MLVDPARSLELRSEPTGPDGRFSVGAAPEGRYTILVETSAGAFLAADSFALQDGLERSLALTLAPSPVQAAAGLAQQQGTSGSPTWLKWVIVGAVGLAALFVIDETTSEEDVPASPF